MLKRKNKIIILVLVTTDFKRVYYYVDKWIGNKKLTCSMKKIKTVIISTLETGKSLCFLEFCVC